MLHLPNAAATVNGYTGTSISSTISSHTRPRGEICRTYLDLPANFMFLLIYKMHTRLLHMICLTILLLQYCHTNYHYSVRWIRKIRGWIFAKFCHKWMTQAKREPKSRSRKLFDDLVADREHPEDEDEEAGKRSRNGRERMAKRGPIRFASGFSLLIHLSPVPQHPAAGLGSPSVLTGTQTKLRTRRKVNRSAAPRGTLVNFFPSDNQVLIFTLLFNDRSTTRSCQSRSVTFLSFLLNFFFIHFFDDFEYFFRGSFYCQRSRKVIARCSLELSLLVPM